MAGIVDWLVSVHLPTLTAGVGLGASGISLLRWAAHKVRYNRSPTPGEPRIFIRFVQSLPNGALLEAEILNIAESDVWIDELIPVSRSGGLILPVDEKLLTDTQKTVVLPDDAALGMTIGRRVAPKETTKLLFWVGGREWPIHKASLSFRWSPYGPAARQNSLTIHCRF